MDLEKNLEPGTRVDSLFESLGQQVYEDHKITKEMSSLRLEIFGIEGKPAKPEELSNITKEVFEELPQLEQLEINYESFAVTGEQFKKIGENFCDCKTSELRELFLDFNETQVDPKDIYQFFLNISRAENKPNLEKLGFWINHETFGKIAPIAAAFKQGRLKSIKTLQFVFESSNLQDEKDLEEFAYNLATAGFTRLEHLRLCLSVNKYQLGLVSLAKGFSRAMKENSEESKKFQQSLTKIQLEFEENGMTDNGIKEFGQLISESFPSLENLMLNLEENQITKEGLKSFGEGLRNNGKFDKIRRIVLNLNDNVGINGGLKQFGDLLSKAKCLESLSCFWLECERCDLHDDDLDGFLMAFFSKASTIKDLKKIKLLMFQNKFTEIDLDHIADALDTGNLRNCQILDFQVNNPDFKTVKANKFKIVAPKWMKHSAMYFRFSMLSQSNNIQYSIINQHHFFLDSENLKFPEVEEFIKKRQWKYQAAFAAYEVGKDKLEKEGFDRYQTITSKIIAEYFDFN